MILMLIIILFLIVALVYLYCPIIKECIQYLRPNTQDRSEQGGAPSVTESMQRRKELDDLQALITIKIVRLNFEGTNRDDISQKSSLPCCICLDDIIKEKSESKIVFSKLCKHLYHEDCIKNWIKH